MVYKLVGPVLVKQDLIEAKQTVDKRLDYITKEVLVQTTPMLTTPPMHIPCPLVSVMNLR